MHLINDNSFRLNWKPFFALFFAIDDNSDVQFKVLDVFCKTKIRSKFCWDNRGRFFLCALIIFEIFQIVTFCVYSSTRLISKIIHESTLA